MVLTLVLTGIVDYRKFEGIGDPLSFILLLKTPIFLGWNLWFL
jgi:hypothetical protein